MSSPHSTADEGMVLVAGVGNLFMGDDAFGSEVARRLLAAPAIEGVTVRDFGISAVDLLYRLERTERVVVVDVVARGGAPGTLYVLDPADDPEGVRSAEGIDNDTSSVHSLSAGDVLRFAAARARSGGACKHLRIVGCEPESFGEPEGRLGLSEVVAEAVERAVGLTTRVALELLRAS